MSDVIVDSKNDETKYFINQEDAYDGKESGDLLSDGSGERQNSKSARKPIKEVDGRTRGYREGKGTGRERRRYCEALKNNKRTVQKVVYGHECEVITKEHYKECDTRHKISGCG